MQKNGFDAVKFQKRDIYSVYSKEQLKVPRESLGVKYRTTKTRIRTYRGKL